jgi:hypothetical protein
MAQRTKHMHELDMTILIQVSQGNNNIYYSSIQQLMDG